MRREWITVWEGLSLKGCWQREKNIATALRDTFEYITHTHAHTYTPPLNLIQEILSSKPIPIVFAAIKCFSLFQTGIHRKDQLHHLKHPTVTFFQKSKRRITFPLLIISFLTRFHLLFSCTLQGEGVFYAVCGSRRLMEPFDFQVRVSLACAEGEAPIGWGRYL